VRPGGPAPSGGRRTPPDPRAASRIRSRTGELTMTHPCEDELETTLPASPEHVWAAIATGPGIDSWFMGRNEVEPREGGVAAMDTGGHREEAVITAYEPGKRIATRTATGGDGRVAAFEYLIEGRDGGSTVLRGGHRGPLG